MLSAIKSGADYIAWTITLELQEGQDEAFEALMAEMVLATKNEVGAKSYEWFRFGNTVHINERYETNADAGIHLGNFGENFAARFLAPILVAGAAWARPEEWDGIGTLSAENYHSFVFTTVREAKEEPSKPVLQPTSLR